MTERYQISNTPYTIIVNDMRSPWQELSIRFRNKAANLKNFKVNCESWGTKGLQPEKGVFIIDKNLIYSIEYKEDVVWRNKDFFEPAAVTLVSSCL